MDVTQKMRLLFEGGFYSRAAFIQDFTVYIRNKEFVLTVKSVGVECVLKRRLENVTLQILVC